MRSLASSLALFALTLQAQPPKLAAPEPQSLEKIKQFATAHLDFACSEVERPTNSRTITLEIVDPSTPRHGSPSSIDTRTYLQDVFAVSSGTDFEFDHWGFLRGKKTAVYRYSNQVNGKTHSGLVYADENTGAISRVTFRGTPATAHLFCTAQ